MCIVKAILTVCALRPFPDAQLVEHVLAVGNSGNVLVIAQQRLQTYYTACILLLMVHSTLPFDSYT